MLTSINKACKVLMPLFIFGCVNNYETTKEDKEMLLLDSIATLYHSGDFEKSIELGKRFTSEYPSNDKGFHALSSSYLAKSKDSLAEIYADKALAINPDNHIALTNKGILLDKKPEYIKAAVFYEKSLEVCDTLAQTYSNYMVNRMNVGDYANAVAIGEKALKFGDNIWDKVHLCLSYHEIGNLVKRDSLVEELRSLNFEKLSSLEAKISEDLE
jgi:tetratricopeptide (TPR) repeat protein